MAFDGIVCNAVVGELNQCLINGKINKIFQPNNNEILLGVYNMGKNYALDLCIDAVNYRICLSTHTKKNPNNVLNFCMVLRKHLTGGTIRRIYMNGLERIIYIDIECYNELNDLITKTLIFELMGKHSNIVLVNSNNVIIDSLRHLNKMDNSLRDIFPGLPYLSVENKKIDFRKCSFDKFYNVVNEENVQSSIANSFTGISKYEVGKILNDLQIDENNMILEDYKKLYQYINRLIKSNGEFEAREGEKGFYVVLNKKTEQFLFTNFFLDDYYWKKEQRDLIKNRKNYLLSLVLNRLKKLENKLNIIDEKLKDCENMELYKLYRELITTNLYRIDNYNQKSIMVENYYNDNEKVEIPLDYKISPSANAKKYFKKYKKLQNTKSVVLKQKELIEEEIQYLESIIYEINNSNSLDEIEDIFLEIEETIKLPNQTIDKNMKTKDSSEPMEYKIDGYTVYVGKNNKQNEYLTCKMARPRDLWFHTKDIHGSHVVLRLEKNAKAPDSVIYKCATVAAYFSKAKMSQNVPVDYTYIKYVKKPKGAKPGMVIYTDNKTLYVNPQKPD